MITRLLVNEVNEMKQRLPYLSYSILLYSFFFIRHSGHASPKHPENDEVEQEPIYAD